MFNSLKNKFNSSYSYLKKYYLRLKKHECFNCIFLTDNNHRIHTHRVNIHRTKINRDNLSINYMERDDLNSSTNKYIYQKNKVLNEIRQLYNSPKKNIDSDYIDSDYVFL